MRKKNDDLSAFQEWLCLTKNISSRTAAVYASNVRKILAQTRPHINTQTLDAFMQDKARSSQVRSNLMTAWKAFAECTKQKTGTDLPMPSPRIHRTQRSYHLPDQVLQAYGEIREFNRMKIADFATLKRADFKLPPRGGMFEMKHPKRTWEITMIPKRPLEVIFQWGNPIEEPTIPVFPVEPMSTESIPGKNLKDLWKAYKQ